jgi:hypothetical protein
MTLRAACSSESRLRFCFLVLQGEFEMRKIGIAVMLLAAVSWLALENTSEAGRHHRRGRCGGGCYSGGCGGGGCHSGGYSGGCNTGCGSPCETGYSGEEAPAPPEAPAPEAAPAPPKAAAAAPAPATPAPAVAATTTETQVVNYNYGTRRARRGLFRR